MDPAAPRVRPVLVLPGVTRTRFVPSPSRVAWTAADAPWPTETIPMTAATPTITPRIVRAARSLLAPTATTAVRRVSRKGQGGRNACLRLFHRAGRGPLPRPARQVRRRGGWLLRLPH